MRFGQNFLPPAEAKELSASQHSLQNGSLYTVVAFNLSALIKMYIVQQKRTWTVHWRSGNVPKAGTRGIRQGDILEVVKQGVVTRKLKL